MINFNLNNKNVSLNVDPLLRLRDVLYSYGLNTVRDSDDAAGFAGSDAIIFNDEIRYSNLILAYQAEGAVIKTAEVLSPGGVINDVQRALVAAGVVQDGYNSPSVALILTHLLEKKPKATKEDVKEALSSVFIRDAGYEHFYLAVKLVQEERATGAYTSIIAPSYMMDCEVIGKPLGKLDGTSLVRGDKVFVEDMVVQNAYTLEVLRSPYASAYVKNIETKEAEELEGVEAVLTYKNVPDIYYMQAGQGDPEPSPHDRRLINQKVRHVGDRVAAIVAKDKETALKAISLIKVEYEVLPPVFTVEEAMAEGAPRVHNSKAEFGVGAPSDLDEYNKEADVRDGKVFYPFPLHADIKRNIAAGAHGGIGDINNAFETSDAVVEQTFQSSQVQCTPLEPHVCFAKMDTDRLVLHCATQVPYHVRRIVSTLCGLPQNKVHIIKERVGGGYGSKQDILVEDLTGYAAYITRKPIYYRNTREEEFIANSTRHPMRVTVKMSGNRDGKITGIYMDVRANTGPFGNHCLTVPMNAASKTLPLFTVDNMYYDLTTYYSNIYPTGAYQGYGAPKGYYGIISVMAELAWKLGLDPLEMAKKNAVSEGYMLNILKGLGEGREGNVVPVGSCGLLESLETGAKMINWGKKEVSADPDWKIGKGFAMIQQGSGLPGLDHSNCQAKITPDGSVIVLSGGADIGTGLDTISAKIVKEILKVDFNNITVISGDTDSCLFDTGAYASSGTYFSANATLKAVEALKVKIITEAALQMNEDEKDLELVAPGAVRSKKTNAEISYKTLSHDALTGTGRGQLTANASFTTNDNAIPYGAHFAEVKVNVKTGEIKVNKFYAVQDCGTPLNPEVALCQVYGAVQKSIGHTLYEDSIMDKDGRPLNADLCSYGSPMIGESPEDFKVVLLDVVDQYGPYGAKSISEIATNGAAPAIAMAIADATGVWVRSWPITGEKILKGLGKF